jgi:putative restriction endonuclease
MSLIETYDNLLQNIAKLEEARKGGGQIKSLYADLIRRGSVFFPYISDDQIAFAPSRFIGYAENTVLEHGQLEQRNGWHTTTRVREILRSQFGFTIWNVLNATLELHYQSLCDSLGVVPRRSKKTFWITPEVGDWLEDKAIGSTDTRKKITALEQEVLNDTSLPETTREAIVQARIGQGLFRRRVLKEYGCCLITDIKEPALLVASHIKPWRDCWKDPRECLDPENALLLSPTWDRLFDKGFISFTDDGEMMISDDLTRVTRKALGVKVKKIELTQGQAAYMAWHRQIHDYK